MSISGTNQLEPIIGRRIRVKGLVQGVGFRPTVWRIARECGVCGEVLNDGGGVLIRAWGSESKLNLLVTRLRQDAPPLSHIDAIEIRNLEGYPPSKNFTIAHSVAGKVTTAIVADAATCPDCMDEVRDPANRRYRYAFTNCTNCGPRLSITRGIPYDRPNTSMAAFTMCDDCRREYENPLDRRFHAQPNACAVCGPKVWLCDRAGERLSPPGGLDDIAYAGKLIGKGCIVAVKGIGGFHLACDAANDQAVSRLRQRKRRYGKPFALSAKNLAVVEEYAELSSVAERALLSPAAPIVLLKQHDDGPMLAKELAPGLNRLGFMLPYTPLHHLLMEGFDGPIVFTSANISDEPQVTDNCEALAKLGDIADFWLMHDREIVNRLDDSVVQTRGDEITFLRRARGSAPEPVVLPAEFRDAPNILAMGAELKNTFCLLKSGKAIVSQHIGDLEDASVHADYRRSLKLYQQTNDFKPHRIAVDMHPGYFSTRWGERLSASLDCPLDKIQHHHAHIAACMVEHGIGLDDGQVIGIALDGLGYGADGTLWGGEFLLADYYTFNRVAHFKQVPMPGGAACVHEPWRNTFAHLCAVWDWQHVERHYGDIEIVKYLLNRPVKQIRRMIERGLNSPSASSAGRLFDAVAAAIGVHRDHVSYEGQAAVALQGLAESRPQETGMYGYQFDHDLSWEPMWRGLLADLRVGMDGAIIAAKFHNTISRAVVDVALSQAKKFSVDTVVLSGGVFQNALLAEKVMVELKENGMAALVPRKFPANDGGLSLGQAIISAARLIHSGD